MRHNQFGSWAEFQLEIVVPAELRKAHAHTQKLCIMCYLIYCSAYLHIGVAWQGCTECSWSVHFWKQVWVCKTLVLSMHIRLQCSMNFHGVPYVSPSLCRWIQCWNFRYADIDFLCFQPVKVELPLWWGLGAVLHISSGWVMMPMKTLMHPPIFGSSRQGEGD